jgi:hypothetical protein
MTPPNLKTLALLFQYQSDHVMADPRRPGEVRRQAMRAGKQGGLGRLGAGWALFFFFQRKMSRSRGL